MYKIIRLEKIKSLEIPKWGNNPVLNIPDMTTYKLVQVKYDISSINKVSLLNDVETSATTSAETSTETD
jgi:hypothetical protein